MWVFTVSHRLPSSATRPKLLTARVASNALHCTTLHQITHIILLTISVLVASCIGVLLVSLLYEGLKIFRAKLMQMHRMEKQAGQGNGVVKISGVCRDCR